MSQAKVSESFSIFDGLWPVFRKELLQLSRDPMTLFFAVLVPVMQLFLLGYAVDTNVRQIPTVVYDLAKTQESVRLLDRFVNSDDFQIIKNATSQKELYDTIVAGQAKVGIEIPVDYSQNLLRGNPSNVMVYVDGSDSTITSEAVNVSNGIALQESLQRLIDKNPTLVPPVEVRPSVLFNPDTRSANFFIPGLIAVLLQLMLILLISFSIVRERERGTLEQLNLTPIKPLGLMIGKMLPYGLLGFLEMIWVLLIMRYFFKVEIHGSLILLFGIAVPFLLTILGLGLIISTKAMTQAEAMQLAMSTTLPSIFLSGYIFPTNNMPTFFWIISKLIPTTYFIESLRGIILRGASLQHLWWNGAAMTIMGIVLISIATWRFHSQNS